MATLAMGGDSAVRPPATATRLATIEHCQVFLIRDIHISANEAGALVSLDAQEGDHVQAGVLLGKIDDRQAQYDKIAAELKRNVALAKSQDDIEVRFAQAAFEVADAELTQSMEANRHTANAVPTVEIRRLKLTRKKAELEIDRSRLDRRIASMTADVETTAVAAADESIRRRQITAPFAGMVLEVLRDEAEWVNAGEPVLRMIQLDRLRVEGFLSVRQFNPEDVDGRPVTVAVQRARGQVVQLPGNVVFVSPVVQAGDTYRIRAEVENQLLGDHWVLRPGMTAAMTIHVAQ
jgi:macrolide-specific efflux system membrane fusion protein